MLRILAYPLIALGLLGLAACSDEAGNDAAGGVEQPPATTTAPAE